MYVTAYINIIIPRFNDLSIEIFKKQSNNTNNEHNFAKSDNFFLCFLALIGLLSIKRYKTPVLKRLLDSEKSTVKGQKVRGGRSDCGCFERVRAVDTQCRVLQKPSDAPKVHRRRNGGGDDTCRQRDNELCDLLFKEDYISAACASVNP